VDLNTALDVALVTAPAGHPTVSGEAVMMLAGPTHGVEVLDAVNEVLDFAHRAGRTVASPELDEAATEVCAKVARKWPDLSPDVIRRIGDLWAWENKRAPRRRGRVTPRTCAPPPRARAG